MAGSISSFGNFGRSASSAGACRRCRTGPYRPCEKRRPEPDRQGQLRRGQTERLAGIRRRRIRIPAGGTGGKRLFALRHPLGHLGPVRQHGDDVVAVLRRHVKGREVHPVLGFGDDARLALTAERNGRRPTNDPAPGLPMPGRRALPRPPRRRPPPSPRPHRTACVGQQTPAELDPARESRTLAAAAELRFTPL